MNEDERTLRALEQWFEDDQVPSADEAIQASVERVGRTSQRHRWWPFVPTIGRGYVRRLPVAAAFVVAALAIVTVLNLGPSLTEPSVPAPRVGAPGSNVLVVSADGSGDASSIAEAVERAADGDTILLRPGRYEASLRLEKDLTIRGDGPREDIVVNLLDSDPVAGGAIEQWTFSFASVADRERAPSVFLLDETSAELVGFTVETPPAVRAIVVNGGSPSLADLVVHVTGEVMPWNDPSPQVAVHFTSGAAGMLQGSTVVGELWIDGASSPDVSDNRLSCHFAVFGKGSDPLIEGNRFEGGDGCEFALRVGDGAAPRIRGNDLVAARAVAVSVEGPCRAMCGDAGPGLGAEPVLEDNRIHGSATGLSLESGSLPTVRGNEVSENGIGLTVRSDDARIQGNVIDSNRVGVTVWSAAPTLAENTIEANRTGVALDSAASVALAENDICDNDTNLSIDAAEAGSTDEAGCLVMPLT